MRRKGKKSVGSKKKPNEKRVVRVAVNRKYKDTVFRKLFSEPKELLSLYNALNGTHYTDERELKIVTLDSAVYMSMKNDVAFVFDSSLMLCEHQSTHSPSMPLRDLFYISAEYQKMISMKTLYSSKRIMLPTPRFVVFYNGTEAQPEKQIWKLSDSYIKPVEEPDLELKVLVLNINEGYNEDIVTQCRTLYEYCQFVGKIRSYAKTIKIEEAVERAVNECIAEDILKCFLLANRAEVIGMSIFEYNEEEEWKKIRRDEQEIGWEAGKVAGKAEDILDLLELHGEVPVKLHKIIQSEARLEILRDWLRTAARAENIEDFCEKAGVEKE